MTSTPSSTISTSSLLPLAATYADEEGTALFHSGGSLDSARHSYLALFPDDKISLEATPNVWERLQEKIGALDPTQNFPTWVGYLGYEMGCFADPDSRVPYTKGAIPDCHFYRPTTVVRLDHLTGFVDVFGEKRNLIESEVKERLASLTLRPPSETLESYIEKIGRIKELIRAGEIYQVNFSQVFELEGEADPFSLFSHVNRINPAPFSAFLNCGDFQIVSSSPERFLQRQGERLETRPIKGTAPRSSDPQELLRSEKERAELLMITDLMRNDVGRVSLPGGVTTRDIWRCEAYTNVYHLLSIIEGRVDPSLHAIEILRQLFPGGSITGCPKLRAMEVIRELEQRPRNLYTGSIGFIHGNGDFDFNIAIRTLLIRENLVEVALGGGIVIDSDPIKEYEETLHKGDSLFKTLGAHAYCLS